MRILHRNWDTPCSNKVIYPEEMVSLVLGIWPRKLPTNYFRIKPKVTVKDLDVNLMSTATSRSWPIKTGTLISDASMIRVKPKGQSGAVKFQRSCIYLYERYIGIAGTANNSHFTGLGWWDTPLLKNLSRITPVFPKASEARHPAGAGWTVKQPKMPIVEGCKLMMMRFV